ncbi:MAG: hypothetical protein AAGD01_03840 [Acidobacteriota bacterium]
MKALRVLLSEIVDYAGLFPPAGLEMVPAADCFARYREHPERHMLGRFVVPLGRLEELAEAAAPHLRESSSSDGAGSAESNPWPLSVLAPPTGQGALQLASFRSEGLLPTAVEAKVSAPEQITEADLAFDPTLELFFEFPLDLDPKPFAAAVAAASERCRGKIRTGGITADAIPTPAVVADFLIACARVGAPFKATAGLHHPLRGTYRLTYEDGSPQGAMYGYLNVFLAAALLFRGPWASQSFEASRRKALVEELLVETEPNAFTFENEGVAWRQWQLDLEQIEAARRDFARSFGSCSFEEPVDDLAALELT